MSDIKDGHLIILQVSVHNDGRGDILRVVIAIVFVGLLGH